MEHLKLMSQSRRWQSYPCFVLPKRIGLFIWQHEYNLKYSFTPTNATIFFLHWVGWVFLIFFYEWRFILAISSQHFFIRVLFSHAVYINFDILRCILIYDNWWIKKIIRKGKIELAFKFQIYFELAFSNCAGTFPSTNLFFKGWFILF